MRIRSITRWTLILLVTIAALIVTLTALNNPTAQAHRLNSTIPCSGSIQACIDSAIDGDTIVIAAGDYTESLTLDKAVSLTGVDSATTILHALPNDRVLTVTVALTSSTIISGLTFIGGSALYSFGGIDAPTGTLTLQNSRIISNAYIAINAHYANIINSQFSGNVIGLNADSLYSSGTVFTNNSGGAYVYGPTTIINGWFENNHSSDYAYLGSLYMYGSELTLSNTAFIHNSGDAVHVGSASIITVENGYFESNSGSYGGGLSALYCSGVISNSVFLSNTGSAGSGGATFDHGTIINSRFQGNAGVWGGGVFGVADLAITNVDFIDNHVTGTYGGGGAFIINANIFNSRFIRNTSESAGGGLQSAYAIISNTVFISNQAPIGGGIDTGKVDAFNVLFADNSASAGAAISHRDWSNALVQLLHVTIANSQPNPASAIEVSSGTLGITDTIIANHAIAINNTGATVYEDYNLFYGNLTNTIGSIITGGHTLSGDPKFIDPLNDNYHLSAGSAAIDHGIDVGLTTDLDGKPRDSRPDIGAYEFIRPYRWYFPIIYKQ